MVSKWWVVAVAVAGIIVGYCMGAYVEAGKMPPPCWAKIPPECPVREMP